MQVSFPRCIALGCFYSVKIWDIALYKMRCTAQRCIDLTWVDLGSKHGGLHSTICALLWTAVHPELTWVDLGSKHGEDKKQQRPSAATYNQAFIWLGLIFQYFIRFNSIEAESWSTIWNSYFPWLLPSHYSFLRNLTEKNLRENLYLKWNGIRSHWTLDSPP